ncbi:MAG: hypothetical protein NC396_04920 [Bacteroides sp.]|nr:hypothetical protein [Bacteroides sp.]MCM1085702.1 hypothetical protein [Bacteroides sp.]
MKTLMRCILLGVCIWIGSDLVKASNQVVPDTVDKCGEIGKRIQYDFVDPEFQSFLDKDKRSIIEKGGKAISYKVDYSDYHFAYSGEGVDSKDEIGDQLMAGIGTVTSGFKNQYIRCTVSYTREIRFDTADLGDVFDSESSLQPNDFFGVRGGDYPEFVLKSRREWHAVIRIRKQFSSDGTFDIEGDTCMVNGKTRLNVPVKYNDLKFQWISVNGDDVLSDANADAVIVTRKSSTALETTVQCTITDGCSSQWKLSGEIKLLPAQTPASTLTFDDCLPIGADHLDMVATNPLAGVSFSWGDVKPELGPFETSPASSQRIRYPVSTSNVAGFTVKLTTEGGCKPDEITKVVKRKLSDNVKLRILDTCLAAKEPFRVVTEPPLPQTNLRWMLGQPDYTVALMDRNRVDRVKITRNKAEGGLQKIEVMDAVCHGSISVLSFISEAYTDFVARTADGRVLQSGDSVSAGTVITLTAPKHSSITGSYRWGKTILGVSGPFAPPSLTWEGDAEITVTAPNSGLSISVSVYYASCRGKESKSIVLYSR